MPGPLTRDDGAGVEVELQGGVQRRWRRGIGHRLPPAHRRDHPVHLTERQRRRRQQGGPVGHPDGVSQLGGDGRPRGVAVAAVQVSAAKAACHSRNDQRAHQADSVSHSNRKVWHAPALQIAHHARVGDQVVRQHHQIDGGGRHPGMRWTAARNPGPEQRTAPARHQVSPPLPHPPRSLANNI